MSERCPTCGQIIPENADANALLNLLRNGTPHRQLYRGQDGNWYVTHGGGGPWAQSAVSRLINKQLISPVYSDCPDQAYHCGPTLDLDAFMKERDRVGIKKAQRIYIPNSAPAGYEGA